MPLVHRRQFLKQAAAASAALVAAPLACPAEEPPAAGDMPIVDTHQHLWDLERFCLAWVKPGEPLARSFLVDDYREAVAGLNVVKTVYMEVDVVPEQQAEEADYVIELCRRGDQLMAGAVISGRPASPEFRDYITRYKDSPYIKGVREVLHNDRTPQGYCLSDEFIAGVRLLGELGMSYDLCMRPGELADGAKLIDACPDTRFVLDHCGNADVPSSLVPPSPDGSDAFSRWRRDIADLAQRKNVIGKISGIVASARPGEWTADDLAPIVNHTLDVFGPQRVVFGGDWPVCTLAATFRQWVEALHQIVADRGLDERRKLFHDNAIHFYGLA
jgi:L-fuconolactonase